MDNDRIAKFIDEIEAVCKKHGLSISHEDGYGAFQITKFDQDNIDWLRNAAVLVKQDEKTASNE